MSPFETIFMYGFMFRFLIYVLVFISPLQCATLMPKDMAEKIIALFAEEDVRPHPLSHKEKDRRPSYPFITGDGFRNLCKHKCDDTNHCKLNVTEIKDGDCIFIKNDFMHHFADTFIGKIPNRYSIVCHNSDISVPDGQNDTPLWINRGASYVTSNLLEEEHASGKLIAFHGSNLWWRNSSNKIRPNFMHCIPIGIENRYNPLGGQLNTYIKALQRNVINKNNISSEELQKQPLLLVAFHGMYPDRSKIYQILNSLSKPLFFNASLIKGIDNWLDAIVHHKFVLAPFGNGLDTHRLNEILLMGGIPVIRRSSISSCYDDSDNHINNVKRGSLPIVILNSWDELKKERLELEYEKIMNKSSNHWDWMRLTIREWFKRI